MAALTAATVAGLLPALFRSRPAAPAPDGHRTLHKARLAELHRDVEDQIIAEQALPEAQDEIARALLEETSTTGPPVDHSSNGARRLAAAVILLSVPAIALMTYFEVGAPRLATGLPPVQMADAPVDQDGIDKMIASLKQRLVDAPDSAEGWVLLGRSLMALDRYDEAVPALARAHELVGDVPQILLQYADALAMANGGRVTSEARALVVRALAIEPENVTALWLAGLAAAESGERGAALDYLGRARDLVTQTGAPTDELDAMIRRLESDPAEAPPTVAGSASVTVEIAVDPVLNGRFEAEDVLFVFAQTAGERGPPLAVTRVAAGSLPREVVLDDTMAMAPNVTLRRGETVTVTARISRVGRPAARSGDLEGHSEPFVVSDSGEIALVIDGVVE